MGEIKITNHQLMSITTAFICGVSAIIISASITSFARQDAWISAIFAMLVGLVVIWMNTYLGGLFPDKTYVEIIQLLLGKWLGGFIVANFVLMCIIGAPQFVWYVGDFFTTQYFPDMSMYIINTVFLISVVIALLYGIEAIARTSEVFFYGIVVMFVLSMIFVTPNIEVNNILPVMEKGIGRVLKGSLPLLSFTVLPTILLNMVYPVNVKDIKGAKRSLFKGYMIGMVIIFVSVLMCNLVMGSTITASSRYPAFLLTKEINVGIIFTRLEALIIIVWLLTIFNNTVFYFYAGVLGLTQLLKLKNYKEIVAPIGLIMVVLSGFIYKDVMYEMRWDTEVWFPYIATFGLVLPILLLIVYFIKKHIFKMDVYGK